MSSCLRRNKELLRFLCQTKPNVLESIVKEVSPDLMKSITEWSQDVSKGNVPLSSSPKKKLSFKQKKKIIQQKNFIDAKNPQQSSSQALPSSK